MSSLISTSSAVPAASISSFSHAKESRGLSPGGPRQNVAVSRPSSSQRRGPDNDGPPAALAGAQGSAGLQAALLERSLQSLCFVQLVLLISLARPDSHRSPWGRVVQCFCHGCRDGQPLVFGPAASSRCLLRGRLWQPQEVLPGSHRKLS